MIEKIKINTVLFLIIGILQYGHICAQDKLYKNEFPLSEVSLLDGPFKHARDLNIKVLLQYDVDRLLAGYRKEAGLPAIAKTYPNWGWIRRPCRRSLFICAGYELCSNQRCRMWEKAGLHDC